MHLRRRKKSFMNSYTNFILEVMSIVFCQIWDFDVTGWVGLELSVILSQAVERFDM